MSVWALSLLILAASPLVLEQGQMRVEIDPELFHVRFIGRPGGENFVEPLPVDETTRAGSGFVDPGGLITDVAPEWTQSASLRRGPAEVIEADARHVLLLGPKAEGSPLRMQKEFRLIPEQGRLLYRVSLLSSSVEPVEAYLRNTMRVPLKSKLRIDKDQGELAPLAGTESIFPSVVKSSRYWLVPIPPTQEMTRVVLGGFVPNFQVERRDAVLIRRIVTLPGKKADVAEESTFLCVLDSESHSYGATLQGARGQVSAAQPLIFAETWELIKRGR